MSWSDLRAGAGGNHLIHPLSQFLSLCGHTYIRHSLSRCIDHLLTFFFFFYAEFQTCTYIIVWWVWWLFGVESELRQQQHPELA